MNLQPGLTTLGHSIGSLKKAYPIASRVVDVPTLLLTGVATRMVIGLARIERNRPSQNQNPNLTRQQKFTALFERIFIEAIGVPAQVISMYAFQEGMAKLFEASKFLKLPFIPQNVRLPEVEKKALRHAIQSVYNPHHLQTSQGMINKALYNGSEMKLLATRTRKAAAEALPAGSKLSQKAIQALNEALTHYHRRVAISSASALGVGVVASAVLTGYFMQWFNDQVVSKRIIPNLLGKLGITKTEAPALATEAPTISPGALAQTATNEVKHHE